MTLSGLLRLILNSLEPGSYLASIVRKVEFKKANMTSKLELEEDKPEAKKISASS